MKIFTTLLIALLSFSSLAYDGKLKQLDADSLLANKDKYIVLDTRSKGEFDQGHIEGAINIPHNQVADNLDKLKQFKGKTIVVHCRSGRRALTAEQALLDNGFTNLLHLKGDMKLWEKQNRPLVSNK